jgi:hypothetical protein
MALPLTRSIAAALLIATCVRPAAAQEVSTFKPPRGDAAGYFGWFSANKSELNGYDDWYKRVWHGSLSAGYYWTEHLKTEVDFGGTTRGEIYELPIPAGPPTFVTQGPVDHEFSTRRLTLGQHYQFFHNAFFHPAVGGGIALTWETTERTLPPVFARDAAVPGGPIPTVRQIAPARTEGPDTRLRTMGFGAAGFKAYLAQRAFFRSDLHVMFTDRVEDVTIRFGFGVDF